MKVSISIEQANITQEGPLIEIMVAIPEGTFTLPDGTVKSLSTITEPMNPIPVTALVDTGASDCTIANHIADLLGLVESGESIGTNVMGTTASYKRSPVSIIIPTQPDIFKIDGEVHRLPLTDNNFDFIIGRNLLAFMTLTYYGKENKFVLEFEK